MKPSSWDNLTVESKQEIARTLIKSVRGHYLIGQALAWAIAAMRNVPLRQREISNIQDMEILGALYEPFYSVAKEQVQAASRDDP